MSDFQVGDFVVCVDASMLPTSHNETGLTEGRLYRISAIHSDEQCVRLFGFIPPPLRSGWHLQLRFRKLPKADEQFTEQMRALRPLETVGQSPDPSPSIGDR